MFRYAKARLFWQILPGIVVSASLMYGDTLVWSLTGGPGTSFRVERDLEILVSNPGNVFLQSSISGFGPACVPNDSAFWQCDAGTQSIASLTPLTGPPYSSFFILQDVVFDSISGSDVNTSDASVDLRCPPGGYEYGPIPMQCATILLPGLYQLQMSIGASVDMEGGNVTVLPGEETVHVTLSGDVTLVPEPASLGPVALTLLAVCGFGRARWARNSRHAESRNFLQT